MYDELNSVLQDLTDQRKEIQKQIDSNNLQIHEAECFAQEILDKDEEDFTVFSPRRYEDIYRTQLDESYDRKSALQNQNKLWSEKRDRLDVMIHLLESVSDDHKKKIVEEQDFEKESKGDVLREKLAAMEMQEVLKNRIANELEQRILSHFQEIMQKIELSKTFFTQDPMRAKLELSGLSKSIEYAESDLVNMIADLNVVDYDGLQLHELLEKALYRVDEIYRVVSDLEVVSCENRIVKIVLYQFFCKFCSEIQKYEGIEKIIVHGKKVKDIYEIHLSCGKNSLLENELGELDSSDSCVIDYHADGFMLEQLQQYLSAMEGTVEVKEKEIFISIKL